MGHTVWNGLNMKSTLYSSSLKMLEWKKNSEYIRNSTGQQKSWVHIRQF